MSKLSKDKRGAEGMSRKLDVSDPGAGEELTNTIGRLITKHIGGPKLLEAYEAKYGFH